MSASITHKSFNHETGEMKGYTPPEKSGCHCNENPYKEQYEKLIAEAEAARDRFIDAAMSLPRIELEECTEAEIYAMFEDENTNS